MRNSVKVFSSHIILVNHVVQVFSPGVSCDSQ